MITYLETKNEGVSGSRFTILNEPVDIYTTNYDYYKEGGSDKLGLPSVITAYKVDKDKAPYEKVEDTKHNKIDNLVFFSKDINKNKTTVVMNGEEKDVIALPYNLFNFPSKTIVDGKEYKRKWLQGKMRTKVVFLDEPSIEVYDKEEKNNVKKKITYSFLDIGIGTWKKMQDAIETLRTAVDCPDLPLHEIEFTLQYSPDKEAAEMYKVKITKAKKPIDLEAEIALFDSNLKAPSFVPPANPFA